MSESPALPHAPAITEPEQEWGRLDPRMLIVRPLNELLGFIPLLIGLLFLGNGDTWRTVSSVAVLALIMGRGLFGWLTTKYRITDSQVELHSGWVFRRRKAVPRDRIRTADLTAKFGHRIFGLAAIRVGTGQHDKDRSNALILDAVSSVEADRLRQVLLRRTERTDDEPVAADEGTTLAELRGSWFRFAPLTLSGLLSIGAVLGVLMNIANELDFEVSKVGVARAVFGWTTTADAVVVVPVLAAVVLLASVLGSLLKYLLQFWRYRLSRQDDGTVRVSRGLLTTRSVSIEEQRLRGVQVREPLLLRLGGGASASAVTTGLGGNSQESALLLPPAPAAEAHRVAAEVLGTTPSPTSVALTRHPAAARSRRIVRAVGGAVGVDALLVAAWLLDILPAWVWQTGLVLVPLAVLLGLDRYRGLGHTLTDRYLVSRSGSLPRRTTALQRTGIIGWRISSTVFQRRAGLITVRATTAAGAGGYQVIDVAESAGLALADEAVPGLLRPFLERG